MITDIKHLISIRQSLHQNPELSGNEEFTSGALKRVIIRFQPDDIIDNLGGFGVAFVFKGTQEGPTVMFRADMDALPIHELNDYEYSSRTDGVGHQCGHDGHMAIMVGLAELIHKNRPQKGKVVLLFQPAEEIGEGALAVMNDPNYQRIIPDVCFGYHNIPGYPKGNIILKNNTITAASQGLVVKFYGKTSHAAEPEKGISPAVAMAKTIEAINELTANKMLFSDFVLTTIVHARLGERSFGISPGFAEILITLRSYNDRDMNTLIGQSKKIVQQISEKENLTFEINTTDIYPATQNHPIQVKLVSDLAHRLNYKVECLEFPFPWAEDFSQFSQKYPSVFFGIGAGIETPKLHNPDYDFPDDIIPYGVNLLYEIYKNWATK